MSVQHHIVPVDDLLEHVCGTDCWCEPRVETHDPRTREPYVGGVLVIHHAADHREDTEQDAAPDPDKGWDRITIE